MGAYACDTGSLSGGKVYRYRIENGVTVFDKDITPEDHIPCGYSGICSNGKMLLLSTVCRKNGGDIIYTSTDSGDTLWHEAIICCLFISYRFGGGEVNEAFQAVCGAIQSVTSCYTVRGVCFT